jgi:hypothetical protein
MNPIVDGITQDYRGRLHVLKLNANGDGRAAFDYYRVTGHPSYILFRADGTKVWQELGLKTRDELVQQIEAVLK